MFTTFLTSLFATCLLLTGDTTIKDGDSYLLRKAEHLAKIELFYLLPNQRRWKSWFPEIIHYYASVDKARKEIKQMIEKKEWNNNVLPELKRDLLNKLHIDEN
ncbi:unnamed protein product [Rhizophagus irregularis]|uniref:Uncharacterized protein n=1 Tax=Rhizophagus irregularis TaxID=588596 RepID=A0A916DZK0_9GLOM|nr:unnamed protein product [Rhizophagus irregularis]CAB4478317.1 unnamed protein product [Rhizophagus irregularis]CAB5185175.1 unnamed protein product [Rhizophagus irregularis]CAB5322632.1 unnamed protein product [Rhizophagus irregularis]CAB5389329.1 unnamed protein product [Rhizophagus irregularis]